MVSLLTGEPEYLDPLRDETPDGWIVTGYPWHGIQTPEHKAFFLAYHEKYNDYPRLGSVVGYSAIMSLAAGMKKAGGADTEKLVAAFAGLPVTTPFGKITYRAIDHQSTMGAFVGKTRNDKGKGVMVDYRYIDGASVHAVGRRRAQAARRPTDADAATHLREAAVFVALRVGRRRLTFTRCRRVSP